ncbi:MAG: DUF6249 domain-containing protein [Acidobacteriota bacterium]
MTISQEYWALLAGLAATAIVLVTFIIVFGRLKIEQQRTLQKLLESGEDAPPELHNLLTPAHRARNDFRRGMLLVTTGLTLSVFMFFVGGIAWIFGIVPVATGLVYLFFWTRNSNRE